MFDLILLVGLGNPGLEYEFNRHNVGFRVIDSIAEKFDVSFKKMTQFAKVGSFSFDELKFIIAKPLTFMNLSGRAVRFLIDFYKIPISNLFVFHDDIDLTFGRIKIKNGGGNGGHNGLKSIDSLIGTNYWRIRIGVGRPEHKSEVSSYVLGNFNKDQNEVISEISNIISENIKLLIDNRDKLEVESNRTIINKTVSIS